MVIAGQPRLSAAYKEKALGRLIVRHRNPPTITTQPARGVTESSSTWVFPLWSRRRSGQG